MASLNTTPSPLQRFWMLLKPDQREITNVYIYAIFNGLVYLSLPLGIQAIINLIQGGQVSTSWVLLVILVIVGIAVTGILNIFQLRITEILQQNIFTRAAFEFAYRLPRIKLEAMYRHYAPELMNRFFDTLTVQKGLAKILIDFSAAIVQVVFGLIVLFFYHPFFIAFSLIVIVIVYFLFRLTVKKGLTTSMIESKHKYEVLHWLQELGRTQTSFKLAGNTDLPLSGTNSRVESYVVARENHFKVLVKQYSLLVLFKVLIAAGLLVMGSLLVMEQQMNIGQFVAAEIIILLIISSIEKLVFNMEIIYDVLTSIEKIGQVTDLELENNFGSDMPFETSGDGIAVQLENVSFAYPGQSEFKLKAVSLDIKSGEKIMIAGKNNSGKTTLLHVIGGLYDSYKGHLSYNGFPKKSLDLFKLRDNIGECLMEEKLFQGSIMDNITMGRPAASIENVTWIVYEMGLENYIRHSEFGFQTMLDPEGKKISRGIAQKLLLARAMVVKPKLLLLNDCFNAIESEESEKIIQFVMNTNNRWTVISVSNNDSIAKMSDRIVWFENGVIVQTGNFENYLSSLKK